MLTMIFWGQFLRYLRDVKPQSSLGTKIIQNLSVKKVGEFLGLIQNLKNTQLVTDSLRKKKYLLQ